MPELTVPLYQWVISQVFAFAAVVFTMICYNIKRKTLMLTFLAAANLTSAIAAGLLLNWTVFALTGVALIRSIGFTYIGHREDTGKHTPKWIPIAFMIFIMAASITVGALVWEWWLDIVLIVVAVVIVIAMWFKNTHFLRGMMAMWDAFVIVEYLMFFNVIGIVQAGLSLAAMIIFYTRFFWDKTHPKPMLPTFTSEPVTPPTQV
jgi:hypothetical protein